MKLNLLKKAVVIGASALALASSPTRADWTTFVVAPRTSGSFTHAHHPNGRFIFGQGGSIRLQTAFDTNSFNDFANTSAFEFDPAFIAVRAANSGLIGGGGFPTNRGLFPFDPSTTVLDIAPSLITPFPQAFAGIWWQHPTSGRQGWLLSGTNGFEGTNNISFLSADGALFGPVTQTLSSFSGGIATDASGAVYVGLTDLDDSFNPTAEDNKILKFTPTQIDNAVLALINATPAPIARASATTLLKAEASASLAVDAAGRLWIGGFQIPHIQLWDPGTNHTRRVAPLASAPANYFGLPNYQVKSFTQSSIDRISFLANDGFFAENSDLVLGHSPAADVKSRSVQFAASSVTAVEGSPSVIITLTLSSASTAEITVPFTIGSGSTATPIADYTTPPSTVVFPANTTTASITIPINDDSTNREPIETLLFSLSRPTPHDEVGLGVVGTEFFTLFIQDNDAPPIFVRNQNFPSNFRVGSPTSHQTVIANPTYPATWTATGLPPGLTINRTTGLITGTPTAAGDFDRVIITATNQFGRSTSTAYLISIQPLPIATIGTFTGFFDRSGSTTNGLGGRFDLTTTSTGAYTAIVTVGKTKTTTRGTLNTTTANPSATISVLGNAILFTIDSNTGAILGNSPLGSTLSATLTGWPNRPQTDRVGVCNFAASSATSPIDRPQGASHGAITIPAKGLTKIAGRTADGTPFTSSTALGKNGQLLIYQPLYKALGTFCGVLSIADNLTQSISGNLTWSKPAQTTGALYRAGWNTPTDLTASGGRYRPAAGASLPMDVLPSDDSNAVLSLRDGGIAAFGPNPRSNDVFIINATLFGAFSPLRFFINNRTGLIGGSLPLTNGADKRTATFSALLIPTGNAAAPFASTGIGHFTLPTTTKGTSITGLLTLNPKAL